jgi:DNA-binding CsgD family transcriptional regulator
MMSGLYLVYVSEGVLITQYALPSGQSRLGRSPECEIVLPDWTVSQQHAKLHVKRTEVTVTDQNSHNGTFLDGRRIRSSHVALGQEVRFGNYRLVLLAEKQLPKTDGSEQATHDAWTPGKPKLQPPTLPLDPLTPAQSRVLELLLKALHEREIAEILGRSERTVHNHIQAIYKAYSVHKHVDLILHLLPRVDQTVVFPRDDIADQ